MTTEKVEMMSEEKYIGATSELVESEKGLRFDVMNRNGETIPAFVISYDYGYFAYLNRCGHIAVQLDYLPGQFFSDDGNTLMCSTHGAEYAPDTGACLGGPCYGIGLEPLAIKEDSGRLILTEDGYTIVHRSKPETA